MFQEKTKKSKQDDGRIKILTPRINILLVLFFAIGFQHATSMNCLAGGGPENVLLVVNADSASSKLLANHYVAGRNIPSRNVVYLSGIPDRETTTEEVFRDKIIKPILKEIETRKLGSSIDYIVYSSDFPTMVTNGKHFFALRDKLKESGQTLDRRLYAPNASLTSMTYFAGATSQDNPNYIALNSNSYYRVPASAILKTPFIGTKQQLFVAATSEIQDDNRVELTKSIETLKTLFTTNPRQPAMAYWLARRYAQLGEIKNATTALIAAVRLGWQYRVFTTSDPFFSKAMKDQAFKKLVSQIPDKPFDFAPTVAFRKRYLWAPNGFANSEAGQGNQFYLSSILAVTRNHGITEKEAVRQLRRTMAADSSFPTGTFYFTDTSDVRTRTRRPQFDKVVRRLKDMGHGAEIIKAVMPQQKRDILGLTTGTSKFNWTKTGSKILPGAFCDNLTSYGGMMHKAGQTKLSAFLANGAAGASGTIVEPYAIGAKFPHPMVHVHYARGCSLGESFYQSVYGPFQILLVGDALCQPFAKKPQLAVGGLAAGDKVQGKIELTFESESEIPVVGFEMFVDGVAVHRTAMKPKIDFDTTGMTDGYHEIRIVAVSAGSIESSQSIILPIEINNHGKWTRLSSEHQDYLDSDQVKLTAPSNYGDSIELLHNGRSIAKKIGKEVTFSIPGSLLGRGPVTLEALSIGESGRSVASFPLKMQIDGRISERKRDTETEPKKTPAASKK
ncbi:MAG: hypothetical protein AAF939_13025 [Planctomycetota bacterium]